jgi:lysozyme family protein
MKETYNEAIAQVYKYEGGYSNDAGDPGGPTNYGITIIDARKYWKPDATANDVKSMPKSVAAQIYEEHYAHPLAYDQLPSGVDFAILDYGINSGISRATKVLQRIVGVTPDGVMGPSTLSATSKANSVNLINGIYSERLSFLQGLSTWRLFGKGWGSRCNTGKAFALQLASKYPNKPTPTGITAKAGSAGAIVVAGGVAASQYPNIGWYLVGGSVLLAIITYTILHFLTKGK